MHNKSPCMKNTELSVVEQRKYAFWGALASLAVNTIVPFAGFITSVYLIRVLGADQYGLYALVTIVIIWTETAIAAMTTPATIKLISEHDSFERTGSLAFQIHLGLALVSTLVINLIAPRLADFLQEAMVTLLLRLFSIEVFLFCLSHVYYTALTGLEKYHRRAAVRAVRWISRVILIVIFVEAGWAIWGAILGNITSVLLELISGRINIKIPLKLKATHLPIKPYFIWSMPAFLFDISHEIGYKLDLLVLKSAGASLQQASYYAAAQNLAYFPNYIVGATWLFFFSTLLRFIKKGEKKKADSLVTAIYKIWLVLLPVCAIISANAEDICMMVYGAAFRSSGTFLSILVFNSVFIILLKFSAAIFMAHNRPWWAGLSLMPLLPLLFIAISILVPRYGPLAAAWATFAAFAIASTVNACGLIKRLQIKIPCKPFVLNLMLAICAYWLMIHIKPRGWYVLVEISVVLLLIIGFYVKSGILDKNTALFLQNQFRQLRSFRSKSKTDRFD
ncbi:oligosaccharide flippase family protein [candidate division KSB1 bacterium]|nr:oligosaccharide flippase family protein [candidate division KSB1 bacterium]